MSLAASLCLVWQSSRYSLHSCSLADSSRVAGAGAFPLEKLCLSLVRKHGASSEADVGGHRATAAYCLRNVVPMQHVHVTAFNAAGLQAAPRVGQRSWAAANCSKLRGLVLHGRGARSWRQCLGIAHWQKPAHGSQGRQTPVRGARRKRIRLRVLLVVLVEVIAVSQTAFEAPQGGTGSSGMASIWHRQRSSFCHCGCSTARSPSLI